MSDIIELPGAENYPSREDQRAFVESVKAQVAQQQANDIVKNGASKELDEKRAIAIRAFTIASKQLQADAEAMEAQAVAQGASLQRQHELFDGARALRIACDWLAHLTQEEK